MVDKRRELNQKLIEIDAEKRSLTMNDESTCIIVRGISKYRIE